MNDHSEDFEQNEEINFDNADMNERIERIVNELEGLDIQQEIGERAKNSDTRIMIDKIILENFKSYAGIKVIGPLNYVT